MDFGAIFAPAAAWIEAHPGALSWLMGWVAAITAGQLVKQLLPFAWDVTMVKRLVQLVATCTGALVSYSLWPQVAGTDGHAAIYALVCGMSAPTTYTFIKAIIETRWPDLAHRLSWSRVQERNIEKQQVIAPPEPCEHPECFRRKPPMDGA